MNKDYVVKSVVPKYWDGKLLWYSIVFHHKSYPDSNQSVFCWINDMKTFYKCENESQAQSLVWQSCSKEVKLIIG